MTGEIIKLSAMESVSVVRTPAGVEVVFCVGSIPVGRKLLTLAQARRLGDALGFLSNDAIGRPLGQVPPSADSHAGNVGGR